MLSFSPRRALRAVRRAVAVSSVAVCAWAAHATDGSPRRVDILAEGWRFQFGARAAGAPSRRDAAAWTTVVLPHTWNAADGADGGANYARGDGWYVRTFPTDAAWSGRRVFLEIDGASRSAEVFLNGVRLGEHTGGFARFRFDLTPALAPAGDNTLALRVNNADDGTAPVTADFTFFGGLYRGARLVVADTLHFDLLDHGADGVAVTPRDVSAAQATLVVATRTTNDSPAAIRATLRRTIRDAAGTTVLQSEEPLTVAAGATVETEARLALPHPLLWQGRRDPHLYTAEFALLAEGVVRDVVRQRFGVRSFHVDPERGFFLNGEHLDLHGVNRHQDRAGKGWAISADDEREDFALIGELGATAVRAAHYPQSQLWYDLADERGLVVWAEIPVVNEVPADERFAANAALQLREMIAQLRRHPSICFWGVGNETRAVGDVPGKPETPDAPEAVRVVGELSALARQLDPSRLTTYASHHKAGDRRSSLTDVFAFNKYFGWYGGKAGDLGPWLDDVHRRLPSHRIGLSEYGAGANTAQHNLSGEKPKPGGPWHPEEYQAHFHEVQWLALRTRDYVWGKFIWNLCDFAADDRAEGETPGLNDKGLVTYDRRTRKDAFFWYKANWSDEPVLHLAGRRHTHRGDAPTTITAYSNAAEVELFLDGRSLGRVAGDTRIFRWSVILPPQATRVTAVARVGANELRDECVLEGTSGK